MYLKLFQRFEELVEIFVYNNIIGIVDQTGISRLAVVFQFEFLIILSINIKKKKKKREHTDVKQIYKEMSN